MSAKTLFATVVGFLTHHVSDLNNLSDALIGISSALPIDSQDKDRIASVIAEIKTSADNIAAFLENSTVTDASGTVTVKESDIENAVAAVLPALIAKAVEEYVTAHPLGGTGNA